MKKHLLVESLSGIRGIYGSGLDETLARKYAEVFAIFLKDKNRGKKIRVVVGGDTRPSTKKLSKIFIRVFLENRFTVLNAGAASIPMTEFAVRSYGADGGVMITASHNEPEYNGWKLIGAEGAILKSSDIARVIQETKRNQPCIKKTKRSGKEKKIRRDLVERYIQDVFRIVGEESARKIRAAKFRIVGDPNGGPANDVLKKLFEKLGAQFIGMGMKRGVFKRKIEPNFETLKPLIEKVDENHADFGFGFDLDVDRVELVVPTRSTYAMREGNMISGNQVLALGVDSVLGSKKKREQKVVVNIATSHLVHSIARKYKASVLEVDVGETNVVEKMKKSGSPVGGEGSSSGVIEGSVKCREGILSIVLILSLLAREGRSIDDVLLSYPRFYEKRKYLKCSVSEAREKKNPLKERFRKGGYRVQCSPGKDSGIKVLFDKNSWLFFRASKTEPGIYRIIANGDDKKKVSRMITIGENAFFGKAF